MKKRFYEKIIALIVVFSMLFTPVSALAANQTDDTGFISGVKNPLMNSANWMGFLPNGTQLKAINIPAAHDAGTAEIMSADFSAAIAKTIFRSLFNMMTSSSMWLQFISPLFPHLAAALIAAPPLGPTVSVGLLMTIFCAGMVGNRSLNAFAQDQELTIPEQLKQGVRILDCRLSNYTDNANAPWRDCLVFSHGGFKCTRDGKDLTMVQVIEDARAFLKENPTETVILDLKEEPFELIPNSDEPFLKEICAAAKTVVQDALDVEELAHVGDSGTAINNMMAELSDQKKYPDILVKDSLDLTMGEARGKIIIEDKNNANYVDSYEESGVDKWKHLEAYFKSAEDPKSNDYAPLKYSDPMIEKKIAESNCINGNKNFFLNGLLAFISIFKAFGPTTLVKWRSGAEAQALDVNPNILSYDFKKGTRYGWLYMDFVNEALAKKIYETNVFDFDIAGHPLDYISDIRMSYDQNIQTARAHFNNTGYRTFEEDFNVDGTDKILNNAIVNGVKNDGSFNIAVGYTTSKDPKDAVTGLTWTQREWETSPMPAKDDKLIKDYHFTLVDPLKGKNAVELLDEDKDKITTSDGFASFNIGTGGYVTNLYLTHDSAYGERLISLDAYSALNKTVPIRGSTMMRQRMKAENMSKIRNILASGKEMPRDAEGYIFSSNFKRTGPINDVFLFYDTAFNNDKNQYLFLSSTTIGPNLYPESLEHLTERSENDDQKKDNNSQPDNAVLFQALGNPAKGGEDDQEKDDNGNKNSQSDIDQATGVQTKSKEDDQEKGNNSDNNSQTDQAEPED